jgi:glutaminyl-tRNA synthetase
MPPKFDPNDPATAELITSFQSIGLSSSKATEAARSSKNAALLKDLIARHHLADKGLNEKQATLVASLATQGDKLGEGEKEYAIGAIVDHRLKTSEQLSGSFWKMT